MHVLCADIIHCWNWNGLAPQGRKMFNNNNSDRLLKITTQKAFRPHKTKNEMGKRKKTKRNEWKFGKIKTGKLQPVKKPAPENHVRSRVLFALITFDVLLLLFSFCCLLFLCVCHCHVTGLAAVFVCGAVYFDVFSQQNAGNSLPEAIFLNPHEYYSIYFPFGISSNEHRLDGCWWLLCVCRIY